jgi:IrrE N-terminal-like domain
MPRLSQMFDILAQSRALLRRCEIAEPPVDLGKLAREQQIREIRIDDSVLNGELRRLKGGGYMVRLDARDSRERRRFTLAHEIAHTFLAADASDQSTLNCDNEGNEDLCNLAAAELLIPDALVQRYKLVFDIDSILLLTGKFSCSLEAAAWKLLNTADRKGALLLWNIQRAGSNVTARIAAMARTLTVDLPFRRGMVISKPDPDWLAVVTSDSDEIELRGGGDGILYSAQRQPLGKSTVATLVRLSKLNWTARRESGGRKKQSALFRR